MAGAPGGLSGACLQRMLERGRVLLMLDGFDEVPLSVGENGSATHPRSLLRHALAQAIPAWTRAGNRVLLTSRPYGLSAAEADRLGLPTVQLAELDEPLQQLLVRRWFGVLSADASGGQASADGMLSHVGQRAELAPLVANPMLWTAMCVIFNQGKRLPRDKHELYDRILDNVLYNRYLDQRGEVPLIRNRLSVIACGMHTGAGRDEDRQTPQAEATYAEIDQMIQRYRDKSPATEPGYRGALETREDLLTRSGLLLPREDKRAAFYHFTFQDFLAAQLILEREEPLAAFFRARANPERRSTLSFAFSSLMARHTLPDRGIRLLEQLIEPLSLDELPLALVVSDCLEILAGQSVGLKEEHLQRFRQLCREAIERQVAIPARVEFGDQSPPLWSAVTCHRFSKDAAQPPTVFEAIRR